MSNQENKQKQEEKNINIKTTKSSLVDFVNRILPNENELKNFEQALDEEVREEEINTSLEEIYSDDQDSNDVKKLDIKKKHTIGSYFINLVILGVIICASLLGGYYYFFVNVNPEASDIDFFIEAPNSVVAGEEFDYIINLKNNSRVNVSNISIEIQYPEKFIFLNSSLKPQNNSLLATSSKVEKDITTISEQERVDNTFWEIKNLQGRGVQKIKITGKIIGKVNSSNIANAKTTYTPANFSSEFNKETTNIINIKDIGINFNFDYSQTALVGEENEITVRAIKNEDTKTDLKKTFLLEIENLNNIEIIDNPYIDSKDEKNITSKFTAKKIRNNLWLIDCSENNIDEFKIKYRLKDKTTNTQDIILYFARQAKDSQVYIFYEKTISLEIMKSDLNLTIIANGSVEGQAVDFGETINYSISYINKGEQEMKNVVLMAVLDDVFLDWETLADKKNGMVRGNAIVWTKEQIPSLEKLAIEKEGVIDLSIKVKEFNETDLGKDFIIKSYAQFKIGTVEGELNNSQDNISNTIELKVNSDLNFYEEVRYFNEDNIPVGTGPIPPKVGETTSFKIYWTITNNLHELSAVQAEVELPAHVSWNDKQKTSVGSIFYDSTKHKIIWQIGRLPVNVYRADAEFNLGITPTRDDYGRIMVIIPKAAIKAVDNETGESIIKTTPAKTTKLEDDEIAGITSDGRVE